MKHRSELLQVYSNFAKIVETQFSKCIKIFRYDNALEYTQYAFQAILHSYGTALHVGSPPNYHHLRSFGSTYFILLQPHEHNKLEPQSRLCCFLGYGETKRGIGVMILSLIVFMSPAMLSFGNIAPLLSSLTFMPPYLPLLS